MTTVEQKTAAAKRIESNLAKTLVVKNLALTEIYYDEANNVRAQTVGDSDEEKAEFEEFKDQITAVGGLLQPVMAIEVQPDSDQNSDSFNDGKKYVLAFGFRRYKALSELAVDDAKYAVDVPCQVAAAKSFSGTGTLRLVQLIENLGRADMNAMEEALAIDQAMMQQGVNQDTCASMLGISGPQISQKLKLLKLPTAVQKMVQDGALSFSAARIVMSKDVPETDYVIVAKKGCSMAFGNFEKWVKKQYSPAEEGDTSSQKAAKTLSSADLTNFYIPYLEEQVEEADDETQSYTVKQLRKAQLDAVKTLAKDEKTQLRTSIQPYIDAIEKKKAAEEAKDKLGKEKAKFTKDVYKMVKAEQGKWKPDPSNPESTQPSLSDYYGTVAKIVCGSDESKKFSLDQDEAAMVVYVSKCYTEEAKAIADASAKRAEAKKKADAEAAAAEAAAPETAEA